MKTIIRKYKNGIKTRGCYFLKNNKNHCLYYGLEQEEIHHKKTNDFYKDMFDHCFQNKIHDYYCPSVLGSLNGNGKGWDIVTKSFNGEVTFNGYKIID
jgi:hypothetical protein